MLATSPVGAGEGVASRFRPVSDRTGGYVSDGYYFHENFVRSYCNYELARHVVYTEGKTPEETCAEIEKLLVTS